MPVLFHALTEGKEYIQSLIRIYGLCLFRVKPYLILEWNDYTECGKVIKR